MYVVATGDASGSSRGVHSVGTTARTGRCSQLRRQPSVAHRPVFEEPDPLDQVVNELIGKSLWVVRTEAESRPGCATRAPAFGRDTSR